MTHDDKMKWFREARYGMFIHWGLYSIPGGLWKGTKIHGGEWIMKNGRIPYSEYSLLKDSFNPYEFDADRLVCMASRDFGFRYLCITAKHHDGFAMYDSKCSSYTIMNTPYGKDIVRSLSRACEKYGVVFCVYYSQYQDWADPDGFGNTWDFGPEEKKDFRKYLDCKVFPQLRELLTGYGKIGMIWFDTPYEMKREQCQEIADFVRSLQPECLISGRIGYGLGDYRQTGDRQVPSVPYDGDWECPMTLNDDWGFVGWDKNWKSPEDVIRILTDCAGKGGNLLLNIGPDGLGNIPQRSIEILSEVGSWLRVNGKSVFCTDAAPQFPYELGFGCFTYSKTENRLYMHILNYPEDPYKILVTGLAGKVNRAWLLCNGKNLDFTQSYETARDEHRLRIWLPEKKPDSYDTVVVLDIDGSFSAQKL